MIIEVLETLAPVLKVFAVIAVLGLGSAICLGALALAIKAIASFKAVVKEHSFNCRNKWKTRFNSLFNRFGDKIAASVKTAIEKMKTEASVDLRPKIVGYWTTEDGDEMIITDHNGYYKVQFFGDKIPKEVLKEEFILRDVQGWLHEDNVYVAEGNVLLTLAVNHEVTEIYVAELKHTYHWYSDKFGKGRPFNPDEFIEKFNSDEELKPAVPSFDELAASVRIADTNEHFSSEWAPIEPKLELKPDVLERVRKIIFETEEPKDDFNTNIIQ